LRSGRRSNSPGSPTGSKRRSERGPEPCPGFLRPLPGSAETSPSSSRWG
jgi:hypothetical protein